MSLMQEPDLYTVLKLHSNANEREIRTAYLNLSRTCHPDKCRTEKNDGAFLRIQKAYRILSDALLRRYYDTNGEGDIDIAETVRAENMFPPLDMADPHFSRVFHQFSKIVRKTKTLLSELHAYKRSNHLSSIAIKVFYPNANPFILYEYNNSLPFLNVILSSVSLTHKKNFSLLNTALIGSFSVGITRPITQQNFLVSSSITSNPFLLTKLVLPVTFSFDATYPLLQTLDTSVYLNSEDTRGSCTIVLKKHLTCCSYVTLTSTIGHEAWQSHQIYDIEYNLEMQPKIFATVKTSVGSSHSNVALTLHSENLPYCVFSSITLRIDNSQFQVEWHYLTKIFSCFRHYIKQENKFFGSKTCTSDSAQIDLYADYNLNAGLNLNFSYNIPLTFIDPFTKFHYIIRVNLYRGFFCVELRFKRLSTRFDLPIIMSWKPSKDTQLMQDKDSNILSKFSLLLLLLKFGITPILMHQLCVDFLKNSVIPKQFDHWFHLINDQKNKFKIITINTKNSIKYFQTRLIQTLSNLKYLTFPTARVIKKLGIYTLQNSCLENLFRYLKHGTNTDSFEIIVAIYGSLSLFLTYIFCFIEKKYLHTCYLLSQSSIDYVLQHSQSPVTLLQNFRQYILDVREPLKSFVKDNKLSVPPVEFYYLLPGFSNLDFQETHCQNTPRLLYIKYRWNQKVHIRFFVDGSKIAIP